MKMKQLAIMVALTVLYPATTIYAVAADGNGSGKNGNGNANGNGGGQDGGNAGGNSRGDGNTTSIIFGSLNSDSSSFVKAGSASPCNQAMAAGCNFR